MVVVKNIFEERSAVFTSENNQLAKVKNKNKQAQPGTCLHVQLEVVLWITPLGSAWLTCHFVQSRVLGARGLVLT